jgi:hypothetical protein
MTAYQGQIMNPHTDWSNQYFQPATKTPYTKADQIWETFEPNIPENYYNFHNSLYEAMKEDTTRSDEDDTELEDYYYDGDQLTSRSPELIKVSPERKSQQHSEDKSINKIKMKENGDKEYNHKMGLDYFEVYTKRNDFDKRIKNIRKNDDIFR